MSKTRLSVRLIAWHLNSFINAVEELHEVTNLIAVCKSYFRRIKNTWIPFNVFWCQPFALKFCKGSMRSTSWWNLKITSRWKQPFKTLCGVFDWSDKKRDFLHRCPFRLGACFPMWICSYASHIPTPHKLFYPKRSIYTAIWSLFKLQIQLFTASTWLPPEKWHWHSDSWIANTTVRGLIKKLLKMTRRVVSSQPQNRSVRKLLQSWCLRVTTPAKCTACVHIPRPPWLTSNYLFIIVFTIVTFIKVKLL